MHSVLNDLEVQVTSCGGSGRSNLRDNLAYPDSSLLLGGHRQQVVVRRYQAIAVVNLQPVAASPGVPASRTHDASVGRVDPCSAWGSEILPKVHFTWFTSNRVYAPPE